MVHEKADALQVAGEWRGGDTCGQTAPGWTTEEWEQHAPKRPRGGGPADAST